MTRPRKIHLRSQIRNRKLRYKPAEVRSLFRALDTSDYFKPPVGELSVVFLDDARISRLHADFMEDPTPTDVITFPGDPSMEFAGEICVSIDHAEAFSQRKGTDFSRELALYLVHGYLHLAGYDDIRPEWKRRMRAAEKKALSWLDKSSRIPEFRVETK